MQDCSRIGLMSWLKSIFFSAGGGSLLASISPAVRDRADASSEMPAARRKMGDASWRIPEEQRGADRCRRPPGSAGIALAKKEVDLRGGGLRSGGNFMVIHALRPELPFNTTGVDAR